MENTIITDLNGCANQELVKTSVGTASSDYKERFKAEYYQLKIRYDRLIKMLDDWDSGKLKLKSDCPREIYDIQINAMKKYLAALIIRSKLENIIL